MRIAFFSSGLAYRLGGPSFSEALLINELRKTNEVIVFVPEASAEVDFLEDFRLNDTILYKPKEISSLKDTFSGFDLLHLNGHWKWWYSNISRFAQLKKIPYILHPRGMLLVGHRRKQLKKVFNFTVGNAIVQNAERIIALSEYEKRQFKPYRIADDKIAVIPNPIEEQNDRIVAKPLLPSGVENYFLYLGRIERRKNLVFLVRAFRRYRDLGGKNALLIMGPVERDYDVEIRQAVKEEKLEHEVLILPPAYGEKREGFLKYSRALIYPATDEPFGRVPFEALAVGAVPVVPDLGGSSEYLGEIFPDCVYKENDVLDLAKTLMKVETIEESRILEGQKWVRNNLNVEAITKQVLQVYSSAVKAFDRFHHRPESGRRLSFQKPH